MRREEKTGETSGLVASRLSPLTSSRFTALPPLSLYIHIPWCVRKCPYCDFNSHEPRGELPEREYVAALIADLEQALPSVWGRRVVSVFFGGGTPSFFSGAGIEHILSAVRARLPLAPDAEITLEANPGTVESERFGAYRAAGVNRLSLGIQSFSDRYLKALGRIHDGDEAKRAIGIAQSRFENVNLDLMYGLPGQCVDDALDDIGTALSFGPTHISAYHLTIEPNTYFHRYPPAVPDDDIASEMQDAIEERLAAAGFEHYEVSAYAKLREATRDPRPETRDERREAGAEQEVNGAPAEDAPSAPRASRLTPRSARCAHNLNYWTFGDYLGIGAGAHSKLSFPERIVRQARHRQPAQYMATARAGNAVQQAHDVEPGDLGFEFMMNALRLTHGFETPLFEARTGLPLTAVLPVLENAERRGFIERDHARIVPTARGRRFLNDLLQMFLPDTDEEQARRESRRTLPLRHRTLQ